MDWLLGSNGGSTGLGRGATGGSAELAAHRVGDLAAERLFDVAGSRLAWADLGHSLGLMLRSAPRPSFFVRAAATSRIEMICASGHRSPYRTCHRPGSWAIHSMPMSPLLAALVGSRTRFRVRNESKRRLRQSLQCRPVRCEDWTVGRRDRSTLSDALRGLPRIARGCHMAPQMSAKSLCPEFSHPGRISNLSPSTGRKTSSSQTWSPEHPTLSTSGRVKEIVPAGAGENFANFVPLLPVPVREGTTLDQLGEDAGSVRVVAVL